MNRRRRLVNNNKDEKEYYIVKDYGNILKSRGKQLFDQQNEDPIYILTQFFIHKDNKRYNEIKETLKRNVNNPSVKKIYLFNERIYSDTELGVESDKIEQVNLQNRMTYLDCIKYARELGICAYFIITNSDIFFDQTILNLYKTRMHIEPIIQSLLRYEYRGQENLDECPLFGNRDDAQDSWIFHSKFLPLLDSDKEYNIQLGLPGCDQSISHRFHKNGFRLFNDPKMFRSYHCHDALESERDYRKNRVPPTPKPYFYLKPNLR